MYLPVVAPRPIMRQRAYHHCLVLSLQAEVSRESAGEMLHPIRRSPTAKVLYATSRPMHAGDWPRQATAGARSIPATQQRSSVVLSKCYSQNTRLRNKQIPHFFYHSLLRHPVAAAVFVSSPQC